MNDIAKIERALKDADKCIDEYNMGRMPEFEDAKQARSQITEALMLLRKQPSFPKPNLLLSEAKVTLYLIDQSINTITDQYPDLGNKFRARADNLHQAIKINGGGND